VGGTSVVQSDEVTVGFAANAGSTSTDENASATDEITIQANFVRIEYSPFIQVLRVVLFLDNPLRCRRSFLNSLNAASQSSGLTNGSSTPLAKII